MPEWAVLTDVEWAEARSHFEECPAPPDAECATCHAYEKERRRRCHGSIEQCRRAHG